jgi:hypothetical protein
MLAVNKTLSLNSILVVYNTEPLFLSCLHFVSLPAYFSSPLGTWCRCKKSMTLASWIELSVVSIRTTTTHESASRGVSLSLVYLACHVSELVSGRRIILQMHACGGFGEN